ncbi:D-xylose transporter XylE [Xanthovirga aplysinae]|uniref:D-xylose transporter XylE n=1 Tax=Xanthovirga aplysinae TaxID=2529853 RepID=UPI0012BBA1AE|nr:D-xylose transporter XylE [Xanthovirga aplysinae]MTI33390.1 D-xylose transporter XylE [Xanthovirga aplysinae]
MEVLEKQNKKQGALPNSGYNSRFVIGITLVATLGGLLFGYDTAVISGAIGSVRTYFGLTAIQMGWAASSALVGCIIGAFLAGPLSNKFGRRPSLIIGAILFLVSAIGSALPEQFTVFIIYRIIGGAGVGIASMLSPMYIAEIAPAPIRGRLVSFNQFAIVFGIMLVYFVNYFIALQGDNSWNIEEGWRWMFGSEAIPALIFLIFLFFVPESPRWLALNGATDRAYQTLKRIIGPSKAKDELRAIDDSIQISKKTRVHLKEILRPAIIKVLLIGIGLSVLQQVTGINVFLYYAPEIFKKMGSGNDAALLQTVVVGVVNMAFTVVAILTVDKFGRKPLMVWGSLGMGICILAIGFAAYFQNTEVWLLLFILGYIAFFALSLGPVTWVLLSEIFPNRVRGITLSIAVAAQWISNFVVSQTFPMMMENESLLAKFNGAFPFWVYGVMCVVSVFFNKYLVPETKNKSLEEMEALWEEKKLKNESQNVPT